MIGIKRAAVAIGLAAHAAVSLAQAPWVTIQYPQDKARWWWDEGWWQHGALPVAANHAVATRKASYASGDVDVPVQIHSPQHAGGGGRAPVVVFLHGRRGIDELTSLVPLRLAARGFTVVVPDLLTGRLIEAMPIRHDPALEGDAARAIDFALTLPEAQGQPRTCVVSHTRGGYYALKALVTEGREAKTACQVAYYPHWQHPEAPEPMQVYQYAPEVEALRAPLLVFMGEHEQYQRARAIIAGIESLQARQRDARVIVYPGVGRGFEFRPRTVRTFADDLAAKDAMQRSAEFIRQHLGAN